MHKENAVLEKLKGIVDPDLGRDIVSLGFVKHLKVDDAGNVSFVIELTTPACPVKEHFKRTAEALVGELPWAKKIAVTMSAQTRAGHALGAAGAGLKQVANIIAVSSCKGGVGKSTVAVNLAYALKNLGAKVGIFDADVYGPSLPTMVSPQATQVFQNDDGMIGPLEFEGVKLMSFGFVSGGGGPAIMRGPMVTQVINQLLTTTAWGELDYLVLDLPPGTGDIQLTLTQLIPITAAVIVTTPQHLSFVDVVKGIQMFDALKVPVVGVVENMSYFECGKCHEKHHLFGQGARKKLVEQFGIQNSFEIPILPEISRLSDAGTPVALAGGDSAKHYAEIAGSVVREVSKLQHGGLARPTVAFVGGRGIVVTTGDGQEHVIAAAALRRACRCAGCVEEFSGQPLLAPESVPETITPKTIQPMGNYAVAVAWSDGHTSSVYPYDAILKLAAG